LQRENALGQIGKLAGLKAQAQIRQGTQFGLIQGQAAYEDGGSTKSMIMIVLELMAFINLSERVDYYLHHSP